MVRRRRRRLAIAPTAAVAIAPIVSPASSILAERHFGWKFATEL